MGQSPQPNNNMATLAGFAAILMWALLALLTDISGDVPPFQLAAMTFFIGALVGILWLLTTAKPKVQEPVSPATAIFGGLGLFAYHVLYFAALKNAPAVEASLIAYLWPLLIVVGSAFLPGEALKIHHVVGAALGFLGTFLIISGGDSFAIRPEYIFGYGLAFAAAFTWTAYSLVSRKFSSVPTRAVIYYCAISALLAAIAHLTFEDLVIPANIVQWLAILGLGLLPVGAAFYVWDHGMKNGNIQVIGASSYLAPLLSTIILIAAGRGNLTWAISAACLLITVGALLAAKDIIAQKP